VSTPRVIVIVRGGIVDEVRASEPIDLGIIDFDEVLGSCEAIDNKGVPCNCGDPAENEEHEAIAAAYHEAEALPIGCL
jgi:hypothetical protein